MILWRDGKFLPSGAMVSADDRGYLLGDGAFETILVKDGAPAFLAPHIARLNDGLSVLAFEQPIDHADVIAVTRELAARNAIAGAAALRLTITRSGGPRGLAPPRQNTCEHRMITLAPLSPSPDAALTLALSDCVRAGGAATSSFKCIGAYGEHVAAKIFAQRRLADDAVMVNPFGRVAGCTAANLFVLDGARLLTPPPAEGALPGVTRAVVIEEARAAGVAVEEIPIAPQMLEGRRLLVTNSLIGVRLAQLGAPRADAAGDELARAVQSAYRYRLEREFDKAGGK
ncbi:MAG: aminotransferase class IV [Parvularculaceae bacterium]|nr:aminotransferase class IV [Parvularculaceae bacterium]